MNILRDGHIYTCGCTAWVVGLVQASMACGAYTRSLNFFSVILSKLGCTSAIRCQLSIPDPLKNMSQCFKSCIYGPISIRMTTNCWILHPNLAKIQLQWHQASNLHTYDYTYAPILRPSLQLSDFILSAMRVPRDHELTSGLTCDTSIEGLGTHVSKRAKHKVKLRRREGPLTPFQASP